MTETKRIRRALICLTAASVLGLIFLLEMAPAQEEVASAIRRYKDREVSTGYYEEYEVLPRRQRPLVSVPGVSRGLFPYSPSAALVLIRTRLADSHRNIKFYDRLRCEYCHINETRNIHTVRGNLSCRQCHGGEPIASIEYYYSPMNPIRRHAYVCSKCHEGAIASYASYVVHAPNPAMDSTQKTFPVLFYVFWVMMAIAVGIFVVFLPHTILWGIRELLMKKEKTESESEHNKTRIMRFSPVQRLFHLLLILSFLTQGATGLGRLYIETSWGKTLAWVFGGYESCLTIHTYVGIFMICGFLVHVLYVLFKVNWKQFPGSLFGPDSLLPRFKDIKDFFQHIGWFLGMVKAPQFDRWGYWEKFDYWAVFWGISVLGITGLILAYPLTSTRLMPGWGLNVALWIHRIEAIMAMCHVFIIHFFIAHLRWHNFPMDRAMFEGSADLSATSHERPAWVARLEQDGKLDAILVPKATAVLTALFYIFGYAALAVGLYLLIGGLANSPYITW